jgi:hypothetical protein
MKVSRSALLEFPTLPPSGRLLAAAMVTGGQRLSPRRPARIYELQFSRFPLQPSPPDTFVLIFSLATAVMSPLLRSLTVDPRRRRGRPEQCSKIFLAFSSNTFKCCKLILRAR